MVVDEKKQGIILWFKLHFTFHKVFYGDALLLLIKLRATTRIIIGGPGNKNPGELCWVTNPESPTIGGVEDGVRILIVRLKGDKMPTGFRLSGVAYSHLLSGGMNLHLIGIGRWYAG
jgi:hypothetical protein